MSGLYKFETNGYEIKNSDLVYNEMKKQNSLHEKKHKLSICTFQDQQSIECIDCDIPWPIIHDLLRLIDDKRK